MNGNDKMVKYSAMVEEMLLNVIEQCNIVLNDLKRNGETHADYMYEKLNKAKWDLDIVYTMAEVKHNGGKSEGKGR